MHGSERACARSDRRRVRNSTASKTSDSGVEQRSRGDAVGPFPDIAKQVIFKIEKLTERVHRPKAPVVLPRHEMCHSAVGRGAAATLPPRLQGERLQACATGAAGTRPMAYNPKKNPSKAREGPPERDCGYPSFDASFVFFCKRLRRSSCFLTYSRFVLY